MTVKLLIGIVLAAFCAQIVGAAPNRRLEGLPANFPLVSAGQFFDAAKVVVNLAGAKRLGIGMQRIDLLVARRPDIQFHFVDSNPISRKVRSAYDPENLRPHSYDLLNPPQDHPRGNRIILDSQVLAAIGPDDLEQLARSVDRHLEDGGYVYAELEPNFDGRDDFDASVQAVAIKSRALAERLKALYGSGNVAIAPLAAYLDFDNSPYGELSAKPVEGNFTTSYIQAHKPN